VRRVEIVGLSGPLTFAQDASGLHVTVPPQASHDYGVALRIEGEGIV
jgi:alpha-L-fucosidase